MSQWDITHRGETIRLTKGAHAISAWVIRDGRQWAPLSIPTTTNYAEAERGARKAYDRVRSRIRGRQAQEARLGRPLRRR